MGLFDTFKNVFNNKFLPGEASSILNSAKNEDEMITNLHQVIQKEDIKLDKLQSNLVVLQNDLLYLKEKAKEFKDVNKEAEKLQLASKYNRIKSQFELVKKQINTKEKNRKVYVGLMNTYIQMKDKLMLSGEEIEQIAEEKETHDFKQEEAHISWDSVKDFMTGNDQENELQDSFNELFNSDSIQDDETKVKDKKRKNENKDFSLE